MPEAAQFDHRLIGFTLDGAHTPLACSECHANATTPILPEGATRFLGLARDCASCHEDPHAGRFVVACADCHGQATWTGLDSPGHERVLPLIGGHGGLECAKCHAAGGPHALEILGEKSQPPEARDCVACHESPHTSRFTRGAAVLADLIPRKGCVSCHASEHTSFHEPGLAAMTPEQHAASGFALEAPHAGLECSACHAPAEAPFAERFPGRTAEQCSACHADVHAGQFTEGPFAGQECSACHQPTTFEAHAFTAFDHARAALELTGKHLEIACQDCHEKPAEGTARIFRGTPAQCDACHADAHDGFFAPFVQKLATPRHGECERCHDTTLFARAEAGFDHAAFTGFAVLGAHAESACTLCHEKRSAADATGRTFGRSRQHVGEIAGCVSCHKDPHGARFDAARLPAEVEGKRDCARCHVESSFRVLTRDFEHGFWSGFALAGVHESASCAACHAPIRAASRRGRTTAAALGASCADCHEDPHARQFADDFGVTACQRCHSSEREDFLSFDHERDASFPLGEAHDALACAKCHPTSLRNALPVVHYRPLGSECVDCHGKSAEVLLRRQPRSGAGR